MSEDDHKIDMVDKNSKILEEISLNLLDQRSTSAKTVTSNSTKQTNNSRGEKREEVAARKIQAVFRGHKVRQSMKQPNKQEETEPTPQQLESEFREDDPELRNAATKIQASFRGHMVRKQMEKKEDEPKNNEKTQESAEELDIDLSDPELNKAAAKIQASFRGHMVRKEHEHEDNDKK